MEGLGLGLETSEEAVTVPGDRDLARVIAVELARSGQTLDVF